MMLCNILQPDEQNHKNDRDRPNAKEIMQELREMPPYKAGIPTETPCQGKESRNENSDAKQLISPLGIRGGELGFLFPHLSSG